MNYGKRFLHYKLLLKRLTKKNLEQSFSALSLLLITLLAVLFCLYYPGVRILEWWLPKYDESFYYLTIILPMTLFDSNFSVIGSNFLKVIRKERSLLSINVLAVLFTWVCIFMVWYFGLPLDSLLGGIVVQSFIKMDFKKLPSYFGSFLTILKILFKFLL